jgi:hypothetical protein
MVVHAHVPEGSASHEAFQGFVCGVAFGLASPLAGHPLDTLKSLTWLPDSVAETIYAKFHPAGSDEPAEAAESDPAD